MAHATRDHTPTTEAFLVRRALERLREGLYDPFAVRLLTAGNQALNAKVTTDLQRVAAGKAAHLCVCGPYGQGKSHTLTYLRDVVLAQGYAVSSINLDPREAPLHQFRQVYRVLLETLTFPSGNGAAEAPTSLIDAWQGWVRTQSLPQKQSSAALSTLLPPVMPHPFKCVMVALVQTTLVVSGERRHLKRYRDYRPADFPTTLRRMLLGDTVPVTRLRPALKYRQVDFYRDDTLTLRDDSAFLWMVIGLAQLMRQMGYRGWVLLFDEGEAMIQVRSPLRARSYRILHRLLYPEVPQPNCYPVFAFTPEFFQQLRAEDYDLPFFDRDYDEAFRHLSVYQLPSLTRQTWQMICTTLIDLHGTAYRWSADANQILPMLIQRLDKLPLQDTRMTLKGLVEVLDQVQQALLFGDGVQD